MRKKKVAIYYRVSKKAKNNIRMQRKVCEDYSTNKKFKIIGEYIDQGFSGRTIRRPALKKLLVDLKDGKIDSVLVYKLDRLGRKFSHLNFLIEEFEKDNIEFISATQNFNNNTPGGKFMLRILIILSEFESNILSNRIKEGIGAARC